MNTSLCCYFNWFILLLVISNTICKSIKDKEIIENFKLNVEYSTSNLVTNWIKRGEINFITKENNSNGKQSYSIINNDLSQSDINNIKKECKNLGHYKLRISSSVNEFISSINSVRNN